MKFHIWLELPNSQKDFLKVSPNPCSNPVGRTSASSLYEEEAQGAWHTPSARNGQQASNNQS